MKNIIFSIILVLICSVNVFGQHEQYEPHEKHNLKAQELLRTALNNKKLTTTEKVLTTSNTNVSIDRYLLITIESNKKQYNSKVCLYDTLEKKIFPLDTNPTIFLFDSIEVIEVEQAFIVSGNLSSHTYIISYNIPLIPKDFIPEVIRNMSNRKH